jgi:hypothetical protein
LAPVAAEEAGDHAEEADGDGDDADRAGDGEGDARVGLAGGLGVRACDRGGTEEQDRRDKGEHSSRPGENRSERHCILDVTLDNIVGNSVAHCPRLLDCHRCGGFPDQLILDR